MSRQSDQPTGQLGETLAFAECRTWGSVTLAAVMLFDALYAFFQEHQHWGELNGGVEAIACG